MIRRSPGWCISVRKPEERHLAESPSLAQGASPTCGPLWLALPQCLAPATMGSTPLLFFQFRRHDYSQGSVTGS